MKIAKKLICMLMSVSVVGSSIAGTVISKASAYEKSVNIAMLDSILNGSRGYVTDTLINDNLSSNPQARAAYISGQRSMMADILSRYGNKNDPNYNALYKAAVDLMFVVYNLDDWSGEVADTVTELGADVVESLGGEAAVSGLLSDCAQSSKSARLDSMLQEVISADYTSSWGAKINDNDAQLTNIRRIGSAVGALNDLNDYLKSLSGLDGDTADSTAAYLNDVLIPVADSYDKAVTSFGDLAGAQANDTDKLIFEFSKAMAVAAMYETNVISNDKITEIAPLYLLDDTTKDLIDIGSSFTKFASSSIDTYTYIKSIQTQKETLAGPIRRSAAYINEKDSADVMNKYAGLIESAGDEKTAQYEWIIETLKNKEIVSNVASKTVKKGLTTLRDRLMPLYNESIIPSEISSLTGVVSITHTIADKATNVKDTVLKTYELKELDAFLDCLIKVYNDDVSAYNANKTDETAKRALDDLEFIQRLRMRGETVAYRMTRDQLNSPLGKLLSGGCDSLAYYDGNYQDHIDALMAASVCPVSESEVTVQNSTVLEVNYDVDYGGLYGVLTDSSGHRHAIASLRTYAANGITVNSGGTLKLYASDRDLTLPYITNNRGTLEWAMPRFTVNELDMSGGTLNLRGENKYTANSVNISGAEMKSGGSTLECGKLYLSGISGEPVTVSASGECSLSGGMANISLIMNNNDIKSSSASVGRLEMRSKTQQTIYGEMTASEFINGNTSKKGVILENRLNASRVSNPSNTITNGSNLTLSGSFADSVYNGDITVKSLDGNMADILGNVAFTGDVSINKSFKCEDVSVNSGTLSVNTDFDCGTISVNSGNMVYKNGSFDLSAPLNLSGGSVSVEGSRLGTSSSVNISSGTLNIDRDSAVSLRDCVNRGIINSAGAVKLYGDLANNGSCRLASLELCTNTEQSISGNDVYTDRISLTGRGRAALATDIYYTDSVNNASGMYINNDRLIYLHENDFDADTVYEGDLYIDKPFTVSGSSVSVNGALSVASGDLTVSGGTLVIKKGLSVPSGSITVSNGGKLIVGGKLVMNGKNITVAEGSRLEVSKFADLKSLSAITADGTIIFANDTVISSGTISGSGALELRCDLEAPNVSVNGLDRLVISGRTPQRISLSSAVCRCLDIDNNSRQGAVFPKAIYYSESYDPHSSNVSGTIEKQGGSI